MKKISFTRRLVAWPVILACGAGWSLQASAQETTTYTYDANGRVATVNRTGGPSNGAVTSYTYDTADNRTGVTVSNSPAGSAGDRNSGTSSSTTSTVVTPLGEYTIIFVRR